MADANTEATATYEETLRDRHVAIRERVSDLLQDVASLQYLTDKVRKEKRLTEGLLADIGYEERELERLLDHHRKESKARSLGIGVEITAKVLERFGRSQGEMKARGKYANAAPEIKKEPVVPRRGDPEYRELLAALGVRQSVIEAGALQIHFVHMGEFLTELALGSIPPPAQLKSKPVAKVTYRKNPKPKKRK